MNTLEEEEVLVEDGETYFMCVGTCNRVMHYEDTNGEGVCGRCEEEYIKANYEDEEEEEIPPIPAPIKRQNTQWIVDGQVIFNGNPNGDSLLSDTTVNDKTDADGTQTKEYLDK